MQQHTGSIMTTRVWFVTGASRGIGLTLAQRLLIRGYRVAATSRSTEELTQRLGPRSQAFIPLHMDVADEASVGKAVNAAITHFGELDVVVNNAGYGQMGTVEELTDAEVRRSYDVNVFGALNVLRASLPHLRRQRSGHIFNISSIGGLVGGFSGWGIYCSTKFALAGLTEALNADVAPLGIKVTLVYPGYFRTEFLSAGSVARPLRSIDDYVAARESELLHKQIDGNQPGDPVRAANTLIDVFEKPNPPLHLFLGSDAVGMAETKLAQLGKDLTAHRSISLATDF
jgi:NAD(P)-dependent dehydrogenase (short-subunit alcohol dehydrogenase family)